MHARAPLRVDDGPLRARRDPLGEELAEAHRIARSEANRRSWWSGLKHELGWRAYAIPILAIATALSLFEIVRGESGGSSVSSAHDHHSAALVPDARPQVHAQNAPQNDGARAATQNPSSGALPAGPPYTEAGTGDFDIVPGTSRIFGEGELLRFTVEIEGGITEVNPDEFAREVEAILSHPQGWIHSGEVSFQRVDAGRPDFRVSLASTNTVHQVCGDETQIETSCFNRHVGRTMINVARWQRGAVAYGADLGSYHRYVVSHEVGHALNHGHEACPGDGMPAPVMAQQTITLEKPGGGVCTPNSFVYIGDVLISGPPTD